MSMGCAPGGNCCGSCQANALVTAPVNLGELGNPLAIMTAVASLATAGATTYATVKGAKMSKDNKKAAQAAAEAEAIAAANNPWRMLTQSPVALAGLGAVALALILRR